MKGGPYKLLKSLRLWKAHIGDDGAASIAEVEFFYILCYYLLFFGERFISLTTGFAAGWGRSEVILPGTT